MSGVCGIVRFDGETVARSDLDRQATRLAHLGPDRVGVWSDGPVGLGHLAMRTTREDAFDAQPLHHHALSLVADLRLDNREQLAEALSIDAAALSTMPDSALLMSAWTRWGRDCSEHLVGDFAFAVWDSDARTLTLARDHMGQRRLFYHQGDGFFAFSTEIKGLWALPQTPRELVEASIGRRLLLGEPAEAGATAYEGIRSLPGGTVPTVQADGAVESRRYWEPHADPAHLGRDEAYYIETYRKVLAEAVACRLRRATTGAGLFMGGGFDSSAICALAGPVVTAQGRKFLAVSSVMPEDYSGDIHHARRWVEMCRRDMPHLDLRYVTRDGLDLFTDMERGFLATDAWHSPNHYVVDAMHALIAASGARIAMDGYGGDYTLNPRGQGALARLLARGRWRRFVVEFNATRRHLRQSVRQTLVRNVLIPLAPAGLMDLWRRRRGGLALSGPTMPVARPLIEPYVASRPRRRRPSRPGPIAAMEAALRDAQNAATMGSSILAAAHGLEFTRPFHDKRVVELGLAIPEDLHVRNGRTRHLARAALKDLYPPEYQSRRPGNDDLGPDFLMMAKRIEPRVLAEIERMEKSGRLSRYFDFARMRSMLTRRRVDQHASGNEYDTRQALLAFIAARYIEWFRGDNL